MPQTTITTESTWPEGVIARYLTVAGATVILVDADEWLPLYAHCCGCGLSTLDGNAGVNNSVPARWAQSHAERCRAIPRPTA